MFQGERRSEPAPERFPETMSGILAEAAAGRWKNFFAAYLRPCWREVAIHCRQYGFSETDAEDMLQELMSRLVTPRRNSAAGTRGQNMPARFLAQREAGIVSVQFHTWLKAIIRNVVAEFIRSRKRRRSRSLDEISADKLSELESSLTALLDRHWLKDTLAHAAGELAQESASARTKGTRRLFLVLVRSTVFRETAGEIAESCGIDRTTATQLINRSRARFVELACQAGKVTDPRELRQQIERTPEVLLEAIREAAVQGKFPGLA